MQGKKRHAGWGFVFILILCVIGLFAIEMNLPFSDSMHRAVEMLTVLVAYTLYLLWEQKNTHAIQLDEQQRLKETAHRAIGSLQARPVVQSERTVTKGQHSMSAFQLITLSLVSLGSLVSGFIQDLLK